MLSFLKINSFLLVSIAVFLAGGINAGQINPETKRTPLAGAVTFPAVEHNEWEKAQLDPSLKEADKIAGTIDTYFNLKYRSWMKLALFDFGFLFDRKSANGAEAYAYERGLYHFFLVGWREFNTPPHSIESYKYEPIYYELSVDKNRARVRVFPRTTVVSSYPKGRPEAGSFAEHVFTLILKGGQWLIDGVVCKDEVRPNYPHGTDFNDVVRKMRKEHPERQ